MKDSSCKYCTDEGECILENKTCDGCMIDYQLESGESEGKCKAFKNE